MLVLPEGAASMDLKDKPVGGAWIQAQQDCGSLELVHKLIINF